MADQVREALRKAFSLGQTYWLQSDSESYRQNALADETFKKYEELVEATAAATASHAAEVEAMRADAERYRWLRDSGKYSPAWSGGGWGLAMGAHRYSASELDGAVDAARAALKGDKP